MYIVGTSGHIDHGKTSLIRALTGIDCDRLPEEKAREMTIDIGFAQIDYPRFGTVSIIDVPGHERFIRNMVVGAWGIDLALLVIAVDDGWMPQTEDHFRVLQLLGVERIIAVLNKTDLADEEMIEMVSLEVRERLAGTPYEGCDLIRVSSRTGEGIEDLREAIVVNLRRLARASDAQKPYLFVDRVFVSKGYGTVITGTLKNGRFHEDDQVFLLPLNREVRIKKIESHHQEAPEGTPSQRTALNLAGISAEEVGRGYIVARDNFFTPSGDLIVRVQLLEKKGEIKNNLGIELLVGTYGLKARLILLSGERPEDFIFTARLRLDEPWWFYPGEPFIITHPGGYRIIGGGKVLMAGYDPARKKIIRAHLARFGNFDLREIMVFNLNCRGYLREEDLFRMFPDPLRTLQKTAALLLEEGTAVRSGEYLLSTEFHGELRERMAKVIGAGVGLNLREIADASGADQEIARILMPGVLAGGKILEKDGRYFAGDSITEETLSGPKKKALKTLLEKEGEGMEMSAVKEDSLKNDLRDLVRLGFLISLDGNILYHREIYEDMKQRVMALFGERDRISVPEAKEATTLSRKYIIPLLNRMETEGLIKRIGDFRMKA